MNRISSVRFATVLILAIMMMAASVHLLSQQEEVGDDVTSKQEEMVFDDTPEMGGLETLARMIVGSGLVDLFIQGGFAMWPILILLIWGVTTIIWKLVVLSYAKVNIQDFLAQVMPLVAEKKYDEAISICQKTRGPSAMVLQIALQKADAGIEVLEKAVESAAAMELAYLDKGFIPLSTTINLSTMLGFFGTVVGMIAAFDAIALAGEVDATIVASGIKIALITTAAGLAIAIPIQFFNNLFLSMVDGLVLDMQRSADALIETIAASQ